MAPAVPAAVAIRSVSPPTFISMETAMVRCLRRYSHLDKSIHRPHHRPMDKRPEDMTVEELKEEMLKMEAYLAQSWPTRFVDNLWHRGWVRSWNLTALAWFMLISLLNLVRILLRPFIAW